MPKFIFIILVGWIGFFMKAQSTPYFLLNAGYQNINGNYGTLGGSVYFVQNNDNVFSLGLNANMAYMKEQFIILPEAEIGYTFSGKDHAPYRDVNASLFKPAIAFTPYSIQPRVGISVLNLLDIYAGYSFEFSAPPVKSLEGIVFGIQTKVPIL